MLLVLASALVALSCTVASLRRLKFAVAPTSLDPGLLLARLRGDNGPKELERVRRAIGRSAGAEWEKELLAAVSSPREQRAARVNEALTELDHLLKRWSRVPRVCASVATSSAFLLASLTLRVGLAVATEVPEELRSDAINHVVIDAINVAALGMAGAAFCIAVHVRAQRSERAFMELADKLVERLEVIA